MSQYAKMDSLIIEAIKDGKNPLYEMQCAVEAGRIAVETGRDDFRVIDGRLQALRKAGKIVHLTKAHSNGQGGWHVVASRLGPEVPDAKEQ